MTGVFLRSFRPMDRRRRKAGEVESAGLLVARTSSRGRGVTVFLLLFALLGLTLASVGASNLYRNLVTPWETVEGTVLHSEIVVHRSSDGTTWSPLIAYNYTYRGSEYRGSHQPGYSTGDYASVQRLVDAHPPGLRVDIKVNPANPRESRLRLDFATENFEWLLLLVIGAVFLAPGVLTGGVRKGPRSAAREPGDPGLAGLPQTGTSCAVVECPSCHQLVEPVQKWSGKVKCPQCGAGLG